MKGAIILLEHFNCDAIVHQLLEVEAQVTVKPLIKHGKPMVYCVDTEIQTDRNCKEEEEENGSDKSDKCKFTVTQVICVEIPLSFSVDVDINDGRIDCSVPEVGPCAVKTKHHEKWGFHNQMK
jgi:hypothetical protein